MQSALVNEKKFSNSKTKKTLAQGSQCICPKRESTTEGEVLFPLMTYSQKSCLVTLLYLIVKGSYKDWASLNERENRLHLSMEECQCYIKKCMRGGLYVGSVCFGKYNLPAQDSHFATFKPSPSSLAVNLVQ